MTVVFFLSALALFLAPGGGSALLLGLPLRSCCFVLTLRKGDYTYTQVLPPVGRGVCNLTCLGAMDGLDITFGGR